MVQPGGWGYLLRNSLKTKPQSTQSFATYYYFKGSLISYKMGENEISEIILDAVFEVHTQLGTRLLESSYQRCLAFELIERGLSVEVE